MQIRSFLRSVESRAALRDTLAAMLWMITFLGFGFFLYAVADVLFGLSFQMRLIITAILAIATIIALAFYLGGKHRNRGLMWAARQVEQRDCTLKNQLVTIAEYEASERSLPAYVRARLEANLARHLHQATPAQFISLMPERAISVLSISAVTLYSLVVLLFPQLLGEEFGRLFLLSRSDNPSLAAVAVDDHAFNRGQGIPELQLVLTPPAYVRRSATSQVGDGNIVALVGTRVDVQVKTDQELSTALLSVGGEAVALMTKGEALNYRGSFIVKQDSNYYISLTGLDKTNQKWEEVYSIRAIKDRPPEVHITSPASDLLLESGDHPANVAIAITAKDDYEIASMRLKYIKTDGEGDAARFESGEIAIKRLATDIEDAARGSEQRGVAQLDLAALGVTRGSSVVFHAEALDRNNIDGPGAGYSENIVVQVKSAEPLKISLDDLRPDEALKYLTSQRMILIKTERLHRMRGKMAAGDFLSRAQEIATEQRRFRESFKQFAEIESENVDADETEAQESADTPAQAGSNEEMNLKSGDVPQIPRGGSESLREMIISIRAMWKAEGALGLADTMQAIQHEKEALLHLKAAQRGLRYSPRFARKASPVDLKRRYMGELDLIRSRLERLPRKQENEFDNRLRACLALVYEAARALAQSKQGDIKQAQQKIENAADGLLSIKGELASSLLEPASKLKLVGRMLVSHEPVEERTAGSLSEQVQAAFGLTVQVATEMSAILNRSERAALASSSDKLSPATRAKAAAYFRLLANP